MRRRKILTFMSSILVAAIFAWSSGNALAQEKATRDVAKEEVAKNVAAKGKASVNDQAKYLGKISPSERKAAAKRARQLGLYPGIAGRAVQTPEPGKAQ